MKRNILAVSHDAGGAEVLSSYLKHRKTRYGLLYCVIEGPAKEIFIRKGLQKYIVSIPEARKLVSNGRLGLVLASTSSVPNLEMDFIKSAKRQSIKTAIILEHWINYKKRFGFPRPGWRANLPDEIWVVDRMAKKIAENEFGGVVEVKPNFYFIDIVSEYKKVKPGKKGKCFNILFLSEPTTRAKEALKLADFIERFNFRRPILLIIRQHPRERASKYSSVIKRNPASKKVRIIISGPSRCTLIKDIKNSDAVIGMKSSALITASLFKNTICCCSSPPLWFSGHNIKYAGHNPDRLNSLLFKKGK